MSSSTGCFFYDMMLAIDDFRQQNNGYSIFAKRKKQCRIST